MSVLINGIKKPKDCDSCEFDDVVNCHLWKIMDSGEIHPECPIVEVKTPHGRLIDADATMKQWGLNNATKYGNKTAEQQHFSYSTMMMYEIADILDDAPVVIEAEGELWKN